jgi:DNA-binding CsgD family transcriptional regulator
VFVSTQKGFFKYDIVKNTFIPDNLMNRILGKDLNIYCLKEIGQKVWVLNDSKVGFFERNGNFFHKDFGEYSVGNNDLIPNFNLMFPLNDSTNLFTSYHGFTLLHRSTLGKNPELFKPFVLAISAIGKDTIHVDLSNSGFPIPFTHNLLKIDFGLPNFGFPPNSISYSIDGKKWVVATGSPIMVSNIGSGEHKLRIKALYSDIQDVTSDEIVFHIAKPWYFSFWGFCIWIFMVIIFSLLVRLVYRRRIKKAHELLEMQQQEALLQQQSHYENEVLKTQQKLMLLENEQLESEVRFKSKELANLVINNIHRNEVLNNIRELFTKVQEESSQKLPKKYYDKLLESIDQYITGNDDWEVFELNFNKAYEGFFKKLKSAHPGLTPNDLRLSAYLRMNLTTKEIAPLLNISVRSVEVSRYRLRKKLDLTHDDNLIDYMLQI